MRPTSPSGSRSRGSRCPSWCCSLSPWRGSPWTSSRVCARHGWARALVHGTRGSPVGARIAAMPDAQVSLLARGTLAGGIVVLALAISPPFDRIADRSLTAHMAQHLLLTLVAAPLLVVAIGAWPRLWVTLRTRVSGRGSEALGRVLTHPLVALRTSAGVLWAWHAPHAYDAALAYDGVHAAEHVSFVVAYGLYWWPLLGPSRAERSNAFRAFYLLAGTATGGLLGALLTFAPGAWYSHYNATTGAAGLSPLADQHLAGVVMWLLSCVTPVGWLERMIQFRTRSAGLESVGTGLLAYPVLQAADILLYRADLVPVGEDQQQHIELTRDVARRFHALFGQVFTLPESVLQPSGARIMGLDDPSMKMSKSRGETRPRHAIGLVDPPDSIRDAVMHRVTDSGREVRPERPSPGVTNLMTIYELLSGRRSEAVQSEFMGKGYAVLKRAVAD